MSNSVIQTTGKEAVQASLPSIPLDYRIENVIGILQDDTRNMAIRMAALQVETPERKASRLACQTLLKAREQNRSNKNTGQVPYWLDTYINDLFKELSKGNNASHDKIGCFAASAAFRASLDLPETSFETVINTVLRVTDATYKVFNMNYRNMAEGSASVPWPILPDFKTYLPPSE